MRLLSVYITFLCMHDHFRGENTSWMHVFSFAAIHLTMPFSASCIAPYLKHWATSCAGFQTKYYLWGVFRGKQAAQPRNNVASEKRTSAGSLPCMQSPKSPISPLSNTSILHSGSLRSCSPPSWLVKISNLSISGCKFELWHWSISGPTKICCWPKDNDEEFRLEVGNRESLMFSNAKVRNKSKSGPTRIQLLIQWWIIQTWRREWWELKAL